MGQMFIDSHICPLSTSFFYLLITIHRISRNKRGTLKNGRKDRHGHSIG